MRAVVITVRAVVITVRAVVVSVRAVLVTVRAVLRLSVSIQGNMQIVTSPPRRLFTATTDKKYICIYRATA